MAKILVVDDQAANRELVVTLIGHRGHQPLEAADGAEALALARAERPDLIISDILMPTMDGYEFVRQLRADPKLAASEVIFYSAHYLERQARNLAKVCGVSRVLVKPCEPEEILHAIDQALARAPEAVVPPKPGEFDREHLRVMTDKLVEKIADLQQANQRLSTLTAVNLHLASEHDPQLLLQQLCRDARDLIGASYAVLCVKGESGAPAVFCTSGIESTRLETLDNPALDQGLLGEVYAEHRSHRMANPGGAASAVGLPPGYPPLHACLMVPVASLAQTFGWLCLADKVGADAFTEEDEHLLLSLAAQAGRIYETGNLYTKVRWHAAQLQDEIAERKRTADQLRASEAGLHRAQIIARLSHVITGPDGVFVSRPATLPQMIGADAGQMPGSVREWLRLVHPDDRAWLRGKAVEAALKQAHVDFEYRLRGPGGAWLHVRQVIEPIAGPDGQMHWFNTIQDISEQKQAEEKILRLNRVHAVRSEINSAIVRISERDELFRQVCQIAVTKGGFTVARVITLDANGQALLAASSESDPSQYQHFIDQYNSAPKDSPSLLAVAFRSGQPQISNDVAADPRILDRAALTKDRNYALALLPITVEQRIAGVITLRAREAGMFDEQELHLLLELTGNISFALGNIEKEERLRQFAAEREHNEEAILRFATAMNATADTICLIDRSSMRFVYANDAACRMTEMSREELLAVDPWTQASMSRAELERTYDAIISSGISAKPVESKRRLGDGSEIWVETRRHAQRSGGHWTIITMLRDITERKQAETRIVYLNRVYAMLSGINTLIVRVQNRDELFSGACRIAVEHGQLGMAWIGVVDRDLMKIVPIASAGMNAELMSAIKDYFVPGEGASLGNSMAAQAIREKKAVITKDVQSRPNNVLRKMYAEAGMQSMAILPLIVGDKAVGVLGLCASESEFFHTEEMKLLNELAGDIAFAIDHLDKQERLNYLAYYDALTGLANRSLFQERVAQYLRSAASDGHQLALFLIDLERFKNINDSLGQPAGDALLKQVADWLTRNGGDANLLARVGADHFAVVLPAVKPGGGVVRLLEKTARAFMEHPFHLGSTVLRVAAKVGVALYPDDGADPDTLFRHAEAALKKAKAGGERYLFYKQNMTAQVSTKLTLENQLRQALDNGEFVLHYQPKVNLASGKVVSAEALIRWNDPRTGLVPPGRFIPILEETGLITDVGRWALRQAIADYLRWRMAGLAVVRLAVNVSPLQLRHRGFISEVEQVVGVDPHAAAGLELEITESLIMENVQHNIASLAAVRAMGVRIAIDDFGTGFSSLSYLSKLPVDTLKIDRSFVIDMTAGPQGLALVSTIINLAHSLKLRVVAEGVETEEQSHLLHLLDCDEIQGFLFSKPVPGEIFEQKFLVASLAG